MRRNFIVGVFILLTLLYAWATPPLEASDELWHFGVIQHIAETGTLPVQEVGVETAWEQEGSQPPLYYLITSALVTPIDRGDFDAVRQPNPHAVTGIPGAVGNKNMLLHETPYPMLQGTALAVYLVRLFSIGLGAVSVYAVYQSATLVTPERPLLPVLATGLTAFNPMFLFITSSVNNDNLVITLSSLTIWQTLVLLRDKFEWRRSVVLALLLALASLTKLSGLVLLPTVALAALWAAYQRKDLRGLAVLGVLVVGMWALLAGWWYLRNVSLYGELFGTRTMAEVAGTREEAFTLGTLLSEFQGFRFAFWALFGGVNVMTFRRFYDMMDVVTLVAVAGLALHVWRKWAQREYLVRLGLLALTVGIGAAGVIAWTAQTYASQGRLLFPYVAAISPLLGLGLLEWTEQLKLKPVLVYAGVAVFGLFALVVPLATIAPQYAVPEPMAGVPENARPVYARFGDVALVAYETVDRRYVPGEQVPITLYWQVLQPSERDLSLFLHAISPDGTVIGKVDSYPGAGRLRTTTWEAGAIYADEYAVPLEEDAEGRFRLRVLVGWWHRPSGEVVQAQQEDGQPLESVAVDVGGFVGRIDDIMPDEVVVTERVNFGGVITLLGYRLEDDQLTLWWEATGTPEADYTVFVQALGSDGGIVGQGDAPPELPTGYWRAGERNRTEHQIVYPEPVEAGEYQVVIGWYRPEDGGRLDTGYPDDAYPLTRLEKLPDISELSGIY